ncbi:MAG TPA: hypothetical protein PLO05_00440 [Bacteroidales bacterium]|nr:hypothetical protein [Bacteroidales bacterium]
MKKLIYSTIVFGLLLFIMVACVKDNFDFNRWDKEVSLYPSLAAPIAWGDLSVIDAINAYDSTGSIVINRDGFISIIYNANVQSNDVNDIIFIPNQQKSSVIGSSEIDFSGFDELGEELIFTSEYLLTLDMFNSDCEIDSLILKSGMLNITSQKSFQHTIAAKVSFPSITKDGQALVIDLNYPQPGHSYQTSFNNDLTGYTVDMSQTATGYNEIPIEVEITMYWYSNDNSGNYMIDVDLVDMDYSRIHGYFGYNTLIFDLDTVNIELFKNKDLNIEDYYFRDPQFRVYYWNSYGIPTNFYFNHMTAYSRTEDILYNIMDQEGSLPLDSANPYYVPYPLIYSEIKMDSIVLDRDNSNIDEVVSKQPKWISFIAHAHTNPLGLNHNNFATDDSKIEAKVEIELPLWGYVHNFHSSDTVDFDFNDIYGETQMISRLQLRLDMQNGLPVEALAQLYFIDENNIILDSLLYEDEGKIIAAADVDGEGRVIDFARKITILEMDRDRVEQIKETKKLVYRVQANSSDYDNQTLVKIYDDYRVKFDIAVEADFEIDIDLDTIN